MYNYLLSYCEPLARNYHSWLGSG